MKPELLSSEESRGPGGLLLNVCWSTLLLMRGLIAGAFPWDVSSLRDEVESWEVCWLIDGHEYVFRLMQNIHI
ncbi:MAG: hypothetical protein V7742_14095 [Halioglobus sp.]